MKHLQGASRDELLAQVNAPAIFHHFALHLDDAGGQYVAFCPFHEDGGRPNLSVSAEGLYCCFACGATGSIIDLISYASRPRLANGCFDAGEKPTKAEVANAFTFLRLFRGNCTTTAREPDHLVALPPDPPPIPSEEVAWWHQNLWEHHPKVRTFLQEERGLSDQIIIRCLLGYDDLSERITIPVMEHGLTRNVRKYLPHAPKGTPKVISYAKGYGRNRRLNLLSGAGDGPILLMAGEMDCLLARSLGYDQADTFTAGEQSCPTAELVSDWQGKTVYLWYDNDDAGRSGSQKVAAALFALGVIPRLVAFPERFPEGEDFTDLIAAHGYTKADCDRLIEQAPLWVTPPAAPTDENASLSDVRLAYTWDDLGNARRLVDRFGRLLRWIDAKRMWLYWDENTRRWREDGIVFAGKMAAQVADEMHAELSTIQLADKKQQEKYESFVRSTRNDGKLKAMLNQARPSLAVTPDDFDRDPWLLNVTNGLLDLRTGTLSPHTPDRLCLRQATVPYDSAAEAPTWQRFLHYNLCGDEALIRYLQTVIGYCLTGSVVEKRIWFIHGPKDAGKTRFIEAIKELLGDYAWESSKDLVIVKKFDRHPEVVAQLDGRRFVTVTELDDSERFNEAELKRLSGGDTMVGNFKYQNSVNFRPTHKLILSGNKQPQVSTDAAVWRRVQLVPFTRTIPETEQDKALEDKLRQEYPGILRWAIEGCLLWQRTGGLMEPPVVVEATERYHTAMDPLGAFLQARCILGEEQVCSRALLISSYHAWCEGIHSKPLGYTALLARFDERFPAGRDQYGAAAWQGVGLLSLNKKV